MDISLLFFGAAAALFTYSCLAMATRAYQFAAYPRTFGSTTNISLSDLVRLAADKRADLPSFKIVIPAYEEALVIASTLNRFVRLNYPRSHFEIYVVTYEDEPPAAGVDSTGDIVRRLAADANAEAGRPIIKPLHVPRGFDGYFPGQMDAGHRLIGKARGLNYALRVIHQEIERDERSYYIGAMYRAGHSARLDAAIDSIDSVRPDPAAFEAATLSLFDPASDDYVGPATSTSQLVRLRDVCQYAAHGGAGYARAARSLCDYVQGEAPRFFLQLEHDDDQDIALRVMPGREFLHEVVCEVEAEDVTVLAERHRSRTADLEKNQPTLFGALAQAADGEALFQLARGINSRWLAVFDADSDAPPDLFRHLAARILSDPSSMGFQGPVAAVANFADVHPLCRPAGLWMAFCHATSYPRLISRKHWAHPLAGTNWCFRIDGFARDGHLVRTPPYDETRRRFVLNFDPAQLTEDLEAGIRIYDEYRLNAAWHPYLEFEQAPPTPRALIAQWSRWTQGTLQTLAYVLHSHLPRSQKFKLALLPLEVMASGFGPIITVALWALIIFGELSTRPLAMPLTIVLTFANLFYVLPFLVAYNRFRPLALRAAALEVLRTQGPALIQGLHGRKNARSLGAQEHALTRAIADRLSEGLGPDGFLSRHLATRCLEHEAPDSSLDARCAARVADLVKATPGALRRSDLTALAAAFRDLASMAAPAQQTGSAGVDDLSERLAALDGALARGAGDRGPFDRERLYLWLWVLPFLLIQLIPYYTGFARWAGGSGRVRWDKTPRTRKVAP